MFHSYKNGILFLFVSHDMIAAWKMNINVYPSSIMLILTRILLLYKKEFYMISMVCSNCYAKWLKCVKKNLLKMPTLIQSHSGLKFSSACLRIFINSRMYNTTIYFIICKGVLRLVAEYDKWKMYVSKFLSTYTLAKSNIYLFLYFYFKALC